MTKRIVIYVVVFLISVFSAIPLIQAQYEGPPELISLDLKGMDIKDVLKILSQKSGLNIVADKDVKGKVALYIKDVDVMDALDILVSTNGLAYEQKGTLVRIMTSRKYEKVHGKKFKDMTKTEIVKLEYVNASSVTKAVRQMKSKVGRVIPDDRSNTIVLIDNRENIEKMKEAIEEMDTPLTTAVFPLDYAKSEVIKDKLETMLSENVGSIRFDERTNKIVVEDTPKKIQDIRKVIAAFDEKTREVTIDAYIIQVTLSDKYSHGIDWATVATLGDVTLTTTTNLTTSLTGTTPNTFTLAKKGGTHSTVIRLLKTFGETSVLSRPRITVADREEAKILVGTKEVYVTSEVTTATGGTFHTTDHIQYVDVGVSLLVTPEINRAGYIKLKIKPQVSDSVESVELKNADGSTRTIVPVVTTSEAETTVLVKDGAVLIIGGLMKNTVVDQKEKVPFLGDIPILGKLFSTIGKSKEKTEIVILLTPHIIEGSETTKGAKAYLGKWKKTEQEGRIERPEDPKLKLPKIFGENGKTQSKEISNKKQPKPKWEPILLSAPTKQSKQKEIQGLSEETPYDDYYSIVRQEIDHMARQQDVSGLKGEVELEFTLDRGGFVTRGPVVLNKPDLTLVRAAVNCVKLVSPFPPLPRGMKKKEATFYVVVRYE